MTTTQHHASEGGNSPVHALAQPTTLDEALQSLAYGARPIAGGTDLVVAARSGKRSLPASLVAIDRIETLGAITVEGSRLRIGATVTHRHLVEHEEVRARCTALSDAAALVGSPATRSIGTVGGNIMNASPAADTAAPLVVADAIVEVASVRGLRQIPIGELWTAPGQTTLDGDELCTAILLDSDEQTRRGSAYLRLEYRRAMEIAVVGAAAAVSLAPDNTIASVQVALTAVAPTIVTVGSDAVDAVAIKTPEAVANAAADAARALVVPISDVRASDSYRREMVAVMARRAVMIAARRAGGEPIGVPANRHVGIGVALPQGANR